MGILEDYFTRAELAAEFGVKPSTIERWDRLRIGPPVTRKGKTPYYGKKSAKEWFAAGGVQPRRSRPARKLARNSIATMQSPP
jgi:hypothetical protein